MMSARYLLDHEHIHVLVHAGLSGRRGIISWPSTDEADPTPANGLSDAPHSGDAPCTQNQPARSGNCSWTPTPPASTTPTPGNLPHHSKLDRATASERLSRRGGHVWWHCLTRWSISNSRAANVKCFWHQSPTRCAYFAGLSRRHHWTLTPRPRERRIIRK